MVGAVLAALQVLAVGVGVPLAWRSGRRYAPPAGRTPVRRPRRRIGPFTAWSLVTGLLFVNQVLVVVYVRRVWGGDAGRITRYLPPGWFDLPAPGGPLDRLVEAFPAPELLAPSVLRVDAVLELPFGVLAYLAIASRLDRRLAGTLMRPALLVAGCWSVTLAFCLIEVWLGTPYAGQDVLLRLATAAVLPWLLRRFVDVGGADGQAGAGTKSVLAATHRSAEAPGSGSVAGVVAFVVWTAAFAALVLGVYATAALYDLGRVPRETSSTVVAALVLAAAEVGVRRAAREPAPPGPLVATAGAALRWFTLLFWVPAIPLRYGLLFGAPWATLAGALVVSAAAVAATAREVVTRWLLPWRRWAVGVLASLVTGIATGLAARRVLPAWGDHTENRLLVVAVAMLLGALVAAAVADGFVPGRLPADET